MDNSPSYGFEELCGLVDLPPRTVRYYIQMGLVDRPDGQNRGARYAARHVEQLLFVKKWQAAGLALERIRELLHGTDDDFPPPRRKAPGAVEVWSRLQVAPGVELSVEAGEAGLSPEQLRSFFRKVLAAHEESRKEHHRDIGKGQDDE
ncbi:MAG TPA: MerR family transcriptional regulator [Rhodocyclaceae bacterium]|nr:MerR family transcriptional regulator [Rhodocyclaceae bacterium]HMW77162.1 MerR family transcriptional regulator [Rhodocyclaceae bacterium]HNE43756.1 MerR family transcriptional regulator [Rhodocyclaceae bacterium]HNL20377.1 MerR family transcriptional regulator [Rhodocyclaceae bacterium]HNM22052.1 MerR family transcriptional regulator [Rhodocyclaceae bacterium]